MTRKCLTIVLVTAFAIAWTVSGLTHAEVKKRESQFSGVNPTNGQAAVVLVGRDSQPAAVLFHANAQSQEKQAAQQLAKYLTQISGTQFEAVQAGDELPDRAVLVGEFDKNRPVDLSREGFVIRTVDQHLHLQGGSPRATLYAVFCLLEEQLGCRWWSHSEEHVPHSKSIMVTAQNTHIEPAFRVHDLFNREGQSSTNYFAYKRRGSSGTRYTSVHNLCPMLKPYSEKHPEFLPMDKDGKRKFNNIHMNYTAAGMSEIVAEKLSEEVVRRNNNLKDYFYFAGMGDWYGGMDLSPESKRVYEEETWVDPDGRKKPGYSATMLRMINHSAEILEKKHPGITIATHAYMSLEAPPAKTRPHDNVVIEIPRLRHDTVRSIEESKGNQSFRRNLDRWAELAPGRVYIWEYGANFSNFLKPFPCLRSIAANIKHYHKVGVAGIRIQGNYVSLGGDLAVLKNYVWGKLLWDPTRNVDQLLNEFCEGYYGPAASDMMAYVNLLENSVRGDTPVSADEFETKFEKWLRPEIIEQAESILASALARTNSESDEPYYRRVKEAKVSLEAYHLWKQGELKEQGEKLIRADFDEDTMPRARELIKYCRNASPREWGDGRGYRMSFLTMHGGPLAILKSDSVTVKVAPMQSGQIRSVMLNDVVAIDESSDVLNPGSHYYELKSRDGNRVEMEAELGIANWGSNTKQIAYRTVELADGGLVRTTGSVKLAPGIRQNTNEPRIHSIYHFDNKPDQINVEYVDAGGNWQAAPVNARQAKFEIPRAKEIRITRRDRNVVINDRYTSPDKPTAVVEYLPMNKNTPAQIRVTVNLNEISMSAEKPTTYVEREIRVAPLK